MKLRRKLAAARLKKEQLEAAIRLREEELAVLVRLQRERLDIRRYLDFRCDANELESWIHVKLQTVSDENYTDATNLEAKIEKHQSFEAVVAAKSNAIGVLDNTGMEMIRQEHAQKVLIKQKLDKLHRLWELLRSKLAEKGRRLQQAQLFLKSYLKLNYF